MSVRVLFWDFLGFASVLTFRVSLSLSLCVCVCVCVCVPFVTAGRAVCATLVAISESCNHAARSCQHSCGCSYVKHADGSKVFSHNDHAKGWHKGGRGTTVVVFNLLLEEMEEKFFVFTDMSGLASFLNGIPAGMIVSVTTVDDAFAYWRGKPKKAVNRLLESMGMVPPNNGKNPVYRGAYAGFGLSGCKTRGTCPEWAGAVYTGRFGWPATYTAKICTGACRMCYVVLCSIAIYGGDIHVARRIV